MNKKIFYIVITAITGSFIVLNILAYNHAHSMLHYSTESCAARTESPEDLNLFDKLFVLLHGVTIPRPKGDRTPQSVGLEYQSIVIPGSQGIRLGAWYCSAGPSRRLVILYHGYSTDKSSLLDEADAFHNLGFSVLMVDFRGSGDSSESYTSIGYLEAQDVADSFSYAREVLGYDTIILYGHSMGGAAILRAIGELNINPGLVIVEAVFDEMLNTVKNRFAAMGIPSFPGAHLLVFWGGIQLGFNGFRNNPVDYAKSVECPVLMLHGENDPRAKVRDARYVYEALHCIKDFVVFPGVHHESCYSRHKETWMESISEFIEKVHDENLH